MNYKCEIHTNVCETILLEVKRKNSNMYHYDSKEMISDTEKDAIRWMPNR